MAKIYNKKTVASLTASSGSNISTAFTYNGFSSQETKSSFKLYDIDLVKQDIINHFYIRKGEKLMNPDFGTVIWDLLFEQFTHSTLLALALCSMQFITKQLWIWVISAQSTAKP